MRKSERTENELWQARDSVRRHDAAVVTSFNVKPSVHASEYDFGKEYEEAMKRIAKREKEEGLRD